MFTLPPQYTPVVYESLQSFAWVVPGLIWAFSWTREGGKGWKAQWATFAFSYYIGICTLMLYALQQTLGTVRPHLIYPSTLTYGYPSLPAFYVGVGGAWIIGQMFFMGVRYGIIRWIMVGGWWLIIPGVLVWFGFNTWQEVLISLLTGVFFTVIYLLAVAWYLKPFIPWIVNSPPWTWVGCVDTWIGTRAQQRQARQVEECVAQAKNHADGRRLALFY